MTSGLGSAHEAAESALRSAGQDRAVCALPWPSFVDVCVAASAREEAASTPAHARRGIRSDIGEWSVATQAATTTRTIAEIHALGPAPALIEVRDHTDMRALSSVPLGARLHRETGRTTHRSRGVRSGGCLRHAHVLELDVDDIDDGLQVHTCVKIRYRGGKITVNMRNKETKMRWHETRGM